MGQGDRPEEHGFHGAKAFAQEQGRDRLACQRLDPLLQLRDLLRVRCGEVGFFRGVLRQVEQLDLGGQNYIGWA